MEPISLNQGRLRGPILRLQSDERLARMAAAGDDGAFEVLVRRHRPTLQRACRRVLTGSQAEDAAQQALLNAHRALRRNGAPQLFEPWLYRIAFNAALKELQAAPDDLPLDAEGVYGVEQTAEQVECQERLRATFGAIGALPERQRRALVLREMEGRSHDEIARDLGLSRGAVRQLIHRARISVRSMVSALTPYGLLLRIASDSDGSTRVAEVVAGGGAGAYVAKTLVAALVAGGIASGVALVPDEGTPKGIAGERSGGSEAGDADGGSSSFDDGSTTSAGREDGGGKEGMREHKDESRDEDNSGPGGGEDGDGGRGPNSGSEGSGSSGSGTSGGREDSEGSGSSGSGSGSGSSGSSGSGSGTSGSSGSGSSGSGSDDSGSGSGEDEGPARAEPSAKA